MQPIKKILAPVDFTEASNASVAYAVGLAERLGATVTLIHVYPIPVYGFSDGAIITSPQVASDISASAQKGLDLAIERVKGGSVAVTGILSNGEAATEIVRTAETEKADLIVMGTHGRHGLSRALLGSVAESVLRTSPIPVLTVRTATG